MQVQLINNTAIKLNHLHVRVIVLLNSFILFPRQLFQETGTNTNSNNNDRKKALFYALLFHTVLVTIPTYSKQEVQVPPALFCKYTFIFLTFILFPFIITSRTTTTILKSFPSLLAYCMLNVWCLYMPVSFSNSVLLGKSFVMHHPAPTSETLQH